MILRRLENKKKISSEIIQHFPDHKIYIEPFFGAGGMFFNKPKVKYNIVNDLDSDVFNLFQVVMQKKEELKKAFFMMPIHNDLLNYWKDNLETDPIKKALRFLFLSNLTVLGKMDTLKYTPRDDSKKMFYKYIDATFNYLSDVKFNNKDFREFFANINFIDTDYGKPSGEKLHTFIYNDSPYLDTVNTYSDNGKWSKDDLRDLIDCNKTTGCKFAISEFDHDFVIALAETMNLNIIRIGERQNLKNRRNEILITNYKNRQPELF